MISESKLFLIRNRKFVNQSEFHGIISEIGPSKLGIRIYSQQLLIIKIRNPSSDSEAFAIGDFTLKNETEIRIWKSEVHVSELLKLQSKLILIKWFRNWIMTVLVFASITWNRKFKICNRIWYLSFSQSELLEPSNGFLPWLFWFWLFKSKNELISFIWRRWYNLHVQSS